MLKTALRAAGLAFAVSGDHFGSIAGDERLVTGLLQQFIDVIPCLALRRGLVVLPAIDGGEGHIEPLGKLLLTQMELGPEITKDRTEVFRISHA